MRWLLLAFALGVTALQQQGALPSNANAVDALVPLVIAALAASIAHRSAGRRMRTANAVAWAAVALATGMAGFYYAAWRADARLADALPSAWEGRDIRLTGIIDELPQTAERGTRFAFSVERV